MVLEALLRPLLDSLGSLWGGVLALVGLPRPLLVRQEPPKYLFGAPTRRQKGPRSATMERLGFHNVVLESLDLILELPGTNFESSGRCFWASE